MSEGVQISTQAELTQPQADQNLMRADENYNYEMSVNGQTLPADYLDVQISQGPEPGSVISSSTEETQVVYMKIHSNRLYLSIASLCNINSS